MQNVNNPTAVGAAPLHLRGIRAALNTAYRFSPRLAGLWCYRVLAKPPRVALTPAERAFFATAEQAVLPVGIMRIRTYRWPGDGPRVLLAHGWNSHAGRWLPLATRLRAAGYDVYALDAPAHGASYGGSFAIVYYADVMAAAIAATEPEAVVGHSAGGMATLLYLHQWPERARPARLVLMGVPAELTEFIASFQRVIGMRAEVIGALEREFVRRFNKSFDYFSNVEFVRRLDLPGLVVHDRADAIAPASGAERLAAHWAGAELLLTDGLGHSVLADEVDERVVDWLSAG